MAVVTKERKPHFATINDEEFLEIIRNKDRVNTQRATEKFVKIFKAYLTTKDLRTDFEEWDLLRLSEILNRFKKDGELYKTGTMINIRAGLNMYLNGKGKATSGLNQGNGIFRSQFSIYGATGSLEAAGQGGH